VAADGKPAQNWQYLNVGTNIDCKVTAENGRFLVYLSINDSTVVDILTAAGGRPGGAAPIDIPTLRNFSYTNSILLKDGESKQFVAASDKATGEIVKLDVTLNVEK